MDYEERLYENNRSYYWKCAVPLLAGVVIMLYGINSLPQSVPQQNDLTYSYQTSSSQQQTDLRNYQCESIPFKIALGGVGIIVMSVILIVVKVRNSALLIAVYNARAVMREKRMVEENEKNAKIPMNKPLNTERHADPIPPQQQQPKQQQQKQQPQQQQPKQQQQQQQPPPPRQPVYYNLQPTQQANQYRQNSYMPYPRRQAYINHLPQNYRAAWEGPKVYPNNI